MLSIIHRDLKHIKILLQLISLITFLPAKSDIDFMFCLQGC